MQVIVNKIIDLSNCTPEDLKLGYPRGTQLNIELDGLSVISIQGHNMLSDTYYTLPIIDKSNYDVLTKAKKAGMYEVDISCVNTVKIETESNKGNIYIKVIENKRGQQKGEE